MRFLAASAAVVWAAALLLLTGSSAHAQQPPASWLDAPLQPWNAPGASVPAAPPYADPGNPQCAARVRPPATAEERQVAAAGWKLEDYWQTQRAGSTALVLATVGHDGMCRPAGYNGFVFVDGRFAGTLSPVAMFSREDGALFGVPTIAAGGFNATFVRYRPTDPLCCPSRPPTTVVYRLETAAGGPQLVPARTASPAQLPRTGRSDIPRLMAALLVGALLMALAALRLATGLASPVWGAVRLVRWGRGAR